MNYSDIRNYIDALEWLKALDRTLPIGDWRAGDVDFWPLARAMLGTFLHEQLRKSEAESPIDRPAASHGAQLAELQRTTKTHRAGPWRGRIGDAGVLLPKKRKKLVLSEADIALLDANRLPARLFDERRRRELWKPDHRWLFVSNGNLDQPIEGRTVNRLFFPIMEKARRLGVQVREIVSAPVAADYSVGRPYLHGMADGLWWLRRKSREEPVDVSMPGLEGLMARVEGTPLHDYLATGALEAAARTVSAYARTFAELLRDEGVSAVFIVPYHSQIGVALCAAARAVGIPVIDIQHGIVGSPNPHYDIDTSIAFNSVPTHIWLWSAHVVDTPRLGPDCRSLVGGNPTYAMVRDLRRDHPEWRIEKGHYEKEILVTLSRGLIPDMLTELIKASPLTWRWWLRFHPSDYIAGVASHPAIEPLRDAGNVVWQLSNELPLPILLEITDVHLTKSSSTVLEAREYRIPTIFYDRDGHDYYRKLPGAERDAYVEPSDLRSSLAAVARNNARKNRLLRRHARATRRAVVIAALSPRSWVARALGALARLS